MERRTRTPPAFVRFLPGRRRFRQGVRLGWLVVAGMLGIGALGRIEAAAPAPGIHAHNDYEQARPLHDALEVRAASIEADVHLVDGRLLVAHDREDVRPERTLESLYLEPLRARIREAGGTVYPGDDRPVILLVDIKSEAGPTLRAVEAVLERYAGIVTRFEAGRIHPGAVTVIVSGNRDGPALERPGRRLAAMDGRLADLGQGSAVASIPLVSDNWARHFAWRGEGAMPDEERARLRALAGQARAEGRLLRFWNTPDQPPLWRELEAAGVGLIGTDNLPALRRHLDRPGG